ncbi:hypothetical protein FPG87_12680 [Flavobacterium psychrophilum]|nr:hypothetical protein FPG87_12680 [Flavobacterium psychrophilum]
MYSISLNKKYYCQHTFVAIAEFSGIIVFKSYFRTAKNTRLRSPQQTTSAGTLWHSAESTLVTSIVNIYLHTFEIFTPKIASELTQFKV